MKKKIACFEVTIISDVRRSRIFRSFLLLIAGERRKYNMLKLENFAKLSSNLLLASISDGNIIEYDRFKRVLVSLSKGC